MHWFSLSEVHKICQRYGDWSCRHLARVPDYLWVAEDGMKMQGYCNSTLWDTTFAVQAIAATGLGSEFTQCLNKAMSAIDDAQVSHEPCALHLSGTV